MTKNLFGYPEHSIAYELLSRFEYPWEALPHISEIITELGSTLSPDEYRLMGENIWVAKDASVAPTAFINGPCIICRGAEIRHCAYIRGNAIVGSNAVVGNSVELKNCILFDCVQVPHFNYVGDSILGYKSHMGAGAITSNVKSDKSLVTVKFNDQKIESGLKKFGAILGDYVEIGCNSVLNPGTVIGSGSNVYPLSSVRGYVPQKSIFKSREEIIIKN
ncbi:MAG: UDP-N-acetylglucosamine pyrophosphorylase [Ruminococcaceae bacterium]|nr:UDP-N-acetylglucosamine pyrophosphorylase [Oscillospiraceae bacterium]